MADLTPAYERVPSRRYVSGGDVDAAGLVYDMEAQVYRDWTGEDVISGHRLHEMTAKEFYAWLDSRDTPGPENSERVLQYLASVARSVGPRPSH